MHLFGRNCLTTFKQFFTLHTCMQKLTLFGLQSLHPFSLFSLLTTRASESAFEIFAPLSFFLVLFPLLNHSPVASYYPIQLPGISPLPNRSVLLLSLFPTCSWSPLSFLLLLQSSCFLLFTGQWQKRLLSALASIASEFYFSHVSLPPFNLPFQQE